MHIHAAAGARRSSRPAGCIIYSLFGAALAVGVFAAPSYASVAQPPSHSALQLPSRAHESPQVSVQVMHRWAERMLGRLNRQRHTLGRRPLHMNVKLIHSAHLHDLRMARRNVLSHQLPGEPFFAQRITNAGYHWRTVGENIGFTSVRSLRGLLALEDAMFHEKPPNNGHRLNIINRKFRHVGIDVIWDRTHRKLWFTQDFGQPA